MPLSSRSFRAQMAAVTALGGFFTGLASTLAHFGIGPEAGPDPYVRTGSWMETHFPPECLVEISGREWLYLGATCTSAVCAGVWLARLVREGFFRRVTTRLVMGLVAAVGVLLAVVELPRERSRRLAERARYENSRRLEIKLSDLEVWVLLTPQQYPSAATNPDLAMRFSQENDFRRRMTKPIIDFLEYHRMLEAKYERASWRPWLPVEPDPPAPPIPDLELQQKVDAFERTERPVPLIFR